jgi:hypothetical protein
LRVIGSSGRSRARFTPRVPAAGGLELVGVGVAISHRSTCRWLRRGGMDRWRNHRQRHGYFPCGIAHLLSTANRLRGRYSVRLTACDQLAISTACTRAADASHKQPHDLLGQR